MHTQERLKSLISLYRQQYKDQQALGRADFNAMMRDYLLAQEEYIAELEEELTVLTDIWSEGFMLRKIGDMTEGLQSKRFRFGDKCSHTTPGCWVVVKGAKVYGFDPPTQLQKDIWLSGARTCQAYEKRLKSLRWYCPECATIQTP
jgi:hypothetical protein